MSKIVRLFRIALLLILYFILCMFAVVTVFKDWLDGAQIAFAFITPIALVWWGEKRRANKLGDELPAGTELAKRSVERHRAVDPKGERTQTIKSKPKNNPGRFKVSNQNARDGQFLNQEISDRQVAQLTCAPSSLHV